MSGFRFDETRIVGENDRLRVEFDRDTGSILAITNKLTGQSLLDPEPGDAGPPWAMTPQGSPRRSASFALPRTYERQTINPDAFECDLDDDGVVARLRWTTTEEGITLDVEARLPAGGDLELTPRVGVREDALPPLELTYPILSKPRPLSADGELDRLVFPTNSGWLIRRPLQHRPLAGSYPDGYGGCSMQVTAYFEEDTGGFYLAPHDPHSTFKQLRFDATEWSITHETWDLRRGQSLEYGYPIVVAPLTVGDWFEPAERYRSWALREAPWCREEPLDGLPGADREARSWLHEDVGLVLWGTSATLDWSPWYRFYAELAGTPLHICASWEWPARRPHAVGREGWFPPRFHPANVAAWEGHYVTPYMNDSFISSRAERFFEDWEPHLLLPYSTFSFTVFSKRSATWLHEKRPPPDPVVTTDVNFFLCPATEAQASLHAWRDATLLREPYLDGVCYDIGSGNPAEWSECVRVEHGHPPGRGREIIRAYDRVNRRSKAAARAETGRYLVQGVEVIIENILGSVDFYVMRAGAGPLGALEAHFPAPEEPPGTGRELIPLFEAVYHDVGPVRHDGWLTLGDDTGDLFFWIASRIALQWGGLLSLHYAINPPERVPDQQGPARVVGWDGAELTFEDLPEPDPRKAAFVREIAQARTILATAFLGYGRMLRPVPVSAETVALQFSRQFEAMSGLRNHGVWEVPEVVHGAWSDRDGNVGLLFVGLSEHETLRLPLKADAGALWDLDLAGRDITVRTLGGSEPAGRVGADNVVELELELAPRRVTLVEIRS